MSILFFSLSCPRRSKHNSAITIERGIVHCRQVQTKSGRDLYKDDIYCSKIYFPLKVDSSCQILILLAIYPAFMLLNLTVTGRTFFVFNSNDG